MLLWLTLINVSLFIGWAFIVRYMRLPWRAVLAMLPTPMLGFASSYGVYAFNLHFAPAWVAIIMAAAYEVTYVGIAALSALSTSQVAKGDKIARDAAIISFCQNALAGLVFIQPGIMAYSKWGAAALFVNVPLAMLHAAQVWIAYRAANFTLHKSSDSPLVVATRHNVAATLPTIRTVGKRPASMQKRPQLAAPQPAMAMPIMTDKHAADIVAMREANSPPTSFATIGKQLGMSGEAVRQKYRAAKAAE